jgi:hypothetical protein
MSLAMNLFLGRENDYKEFAIKHRVDVFDVTASTVEVE